MKHAKRMLVVCGVLIVTGCQTPAPQSPSALGPRIDPPGVRCPGDAVPDDAGLASAINVSVERLKAMKRARDMSNAQICRASQIRLARLLELTDPFAPTHGAEALRWRALAERDESGNIPADGRLVAAAQRAGLLQARNRARPFGSTDVEAPLAGITPGGWTALGPGNIGGRVRSLVIHPTNPQKIWVGSVSGGIWTTSDGGASWRPVDDVLPSLTISSLAIDRTNPNVMYAGTGEGVYMQLTPDVVRGVGMYKSTDGGATWNRLPGTDPALDSNWQFVNRVAVHPTNGNIVLAATRNGIYRSTNGGGDWTNVSFASANDLRFNPADGNKAIAAAFGVVLLSTDAGATWTFVTVRAGGGRTEVAYAPSSPNIVYAGHDADNGQVYRSTNGGSSWTLMSTPGHMGAQGFWNNSIWVAPDDPNHVVIGGRALHRSTNAGASFVQISTGAAPNSPHADNHAIVNDPRYNGTSNRRVYIGNDGGVYMADDISVANTGAASPANGWTNLNNGLEITQFYSGTGRSGGVIVGGTQDNGNLRRAGGTNWIEVLGGDGGFVAVDPVDSYVYGEAQWLWMFRSADGGTTWETICDGLLDSFGCNGTKQTNFIAPFVLDPNNSNRLLAGGVSLWRSNDPKAPKPSWSRIKDPWANISAIAVAQGNPDIIWVAHNTGEVFKTTNGTAAMPAWTLVSGALPARYAARILIDRSDHNTVYVTFGGYTSGNVWKTTNGGSSWTDIHGALPRAPVRSITRHPLMAAWLYVGTEVGVFSSQDAGATWFTTNDAPANVSVDELFWLDAVTLVAATHGRGMFSAAAPAARARADFNADKRSDVLWRNASSGDNYLYPLNGAQILSSEGYLRTVADQAWQVAGVGDFDGDGKADILWRNSATGQNYIYFMDGTAIVAEGFIRTVADQTWQVAGIGDFDGDGNDDILWRNSASGENYLYPMNGLAIKPGEGFLRTVADVSWEVKAVGDFDGDGRADVLWRNASSGQNYLYPMNGTAIKPNEGFVRTVTDLAWQVKGAGDFDGDGKADIVWRHSQTGENYLYPMDGTTIKPNEGYLRTVADLDWKIVAVGDYDGDGKSDLLWRHSSTGQNYLYPMDGTSIKPSEAFLRSVPDLNWTVVGR